MRRNSKRLRWKEGKREKERTKERKKERIMRECETGDTRSLLKQEVNKNSFGENS